MAQWYLQKGDDVAGPYTPQQLLDLVRRGQVVAETMLRKDNSAWFPAFEVGGLFEAAAKPSIRYFCPHCDSEVRQPPCLCRECGRELASARRQLVRHQVDLPGKKSVPPSEASASKQGWLARIRRRQG